MQRTAAIRRSRLIDLNILPAELRPHRYPRWYVLGLAAIVVGCVLLAILVGLERSAADETARLRSQLGVITGQLQGVEMDIGRQRALREELAQVEKAIADLQAERASLPGAGGPLSDDLAVLYSATPPGVRIDATSRAEKAVTVLGQAANIESIIGYAKALQSSGSFAEVTITQAEAGDSGMHFAVQVTQ